MNRTNIRDVQESKLSYVKRKQLELQLLKAFDDQIADDEQNMERKSSLLPKGLLNKNYSKKSNSKQDLTHKNYSTSSKKNLTKQNKKSTSRKLLLLKAIQSPQKQKFRYQNQFHFKQQPTNRSNSSKMSMLSVKSYHHNKRKRVMTEFYEQKETQNLVKRLLHVKPSQQVAKQAQLNSYQKHVMAKNIMMHRVSDQPIKKDINPLKKKQSKGSTIELKQQDLRKFIKEQRNKTRQQSLLQKTTSNKKNTSIIYKRRRINTLQTRIMKKNSYIQSQVPLFLCNCQRNCQKLKYLLAYNQRRQKEVLHSKANIKLHYTQEMTIISDQKQKICLVQITKNKNKKIHYRISFSLN